MDVQDDSDDSRNTSSVSEDAPSMEDVVNNYEGSGSDPEDLFLLDCRNMYGSLL